MIQFAPVSKQACTSWSYFPKFVGSSVPLELPLGGVVVLIKNCQLTAMACQRVAQRVSVNIRSRNRFKSSFLAK